MNSDDLSQFLPSNFRHGKFGRTKYGQKRMRAIRLPKQFSADAMDDIERFADQLDTQQVVHGVYSTEEWVFSTYARQMLEKDVNVSVVSGVWLTTAGFSLTNLAQDMFSRFIFHAANSVNGFDGDCVIKLIADRGKIQGEFYGPLEAIQAWEAKFNERFKKAENLIQWIVNERGDEVQVPLNYRPAIRAAYPWIPESYATLTDYFAEYLSSDASVLILIGPPGTGKTTFIKNLIHRSGGDAKVTYDPRVMAQDGFFAGFISDNTNVLVMEDADDFLQSREEGNTMMHKFLNVADGLISAAGKKMVFSTNLPNVSDIDSALLRPGRCFDIVQFRALNRDEAQDVLDEIGDDRQLGDGNQFTLAEIFSTQPSGKSFNRRTVGFI